MLWNPCRYSSTPGYVQHQLSLKVHEVAKEVVQIIKVLEGEGQGIWTLARSSTATKLDFHMSLCYPSDMEEAAKEMDRVLGTMLHSAVGFHIPMQEEGLGVEHCPKPEVSRLKDKSYQNWMIRTPVRLGGMGLRSIEETRLAAYIGGVEQAVPHFVGERGICKQLGQVLGDMQQPSTRWSELIESGCRTGSELFSAWQTLRQEASESCHYLGRDLEGLLASEARGAGDGCEDGSTRRKISTWLEDTRAAVLARSLQLYPDQTARPVWVNPQLDKLSQGWILSLPGHNGFSQAEFGVCHLHAANLNLEVGF